MLSPSCHGGVGGRDPGVELLGCGGGEQVCRGPDPHDLRTRPEENLTTAHHDAGAVNTPAAQKLLRAPRAGAKNTFEFGVKAVLDAIPQAIFANDGP